MKKNYFILAIAFVVLVIGLFSIFWYISQQSEQIIKATADIKKIERFSSVEDFKSYLQEASELTQASYYSGLEIGGEKLMAEDVSVGEASATVAPEAAERYSETNVQVSGIDEPDTVKTDGKNIYSSIYAPTYWFDYETSATAQTADTKIISAFPIANLAQAGTINQIGELLLANDMLVVFDYDRISGYQVADPSQPENIWTINIKQNSSYYTARLFDDKIYLVTRSYIDTYAPCPIKPLAVEDKDIEISCVEIYHPVLPIDSDVTYNTMIIDPQTGDVEKQSSFVGSSNNSVVYMSQENIYLTYTYSGDLFGFSYKFFQEDGRDLISLEMMAKLDKLKGYDISQMSKLSEMEIIFANYLNSLTEENRQKIENDIANAMAKFDKKHIRELEKTGIAKISLDDLKITATGEVPGEPLNQFSLDEYDNHLRLAVTVGGRGSYWYSSAESLNDLYVLNENLKTSGKVLDLGQGERIYSARFINDKGYLVTFKETDPFYVFDLSDVKNPQLKGELKIPGYSSYLHPIDDNTILGIGKENENVKASLFDVSDPSKPREISKYQLTDYWSDILTTHHAFLLDPEHKIFFLPGIEGGYIISYANNALELKKVITGYSVERALYINDYLYILSGEKIVVLDENTWEQVKELAL